MKRNGQSPKQRWYGKLILLGGVPLLGAMAIDTVAVIGRHVRFPLNGSIELVQGALVLAGTSAMVVATLAGAHATVRLVVDRLPPRVRDWSMRTSNCLSALYFLALVCGGVWLAADMWFAYERSELLGVPYRPLRAIANLGLTAIAALLLWRAVRGERQ